VAFSLLRVQHSRFSVCQGDNVALSRLPADRIPFRSPSRGCNARSPHTNCSTSLPSASFRHRCFRSL
jgi:hypothetical protein